MWDDSVSDEALVQALTEAEENQTDLFDDGVSDEALLQAGGFDFDLEPVVDRRSERLGVEERVFRTRVRQRGNLEPGQDIIGALTQGLCSSMNRLFNTCENADYVGPIPSKDHYMPEGMSVNGQEEFKKWHAEQVQLKNVELTKNWSVIANRT